VGIGMGMGLDGVSGSKERGKKGVIDHPCRPNRTRTRTRTRKAKQNKKNKNKTTNCVLH
jgi:hypothetical protein